MANNQGMHVTWLKKNYCGTIILNYVPDLVCDNMFYRPAGYPANKKHFDVGPTSYKCYTNVLFLLDIESIICHYK